MALYTGRGDDGETGLVDGSRASKASPRVEAVGEVDEAAATIGFARLAVADATLEAVLAFAQQRLFECSSALSDRRATAVAAVSRDDIAFLERATDRFAEAADAWRGFTLASGSEAAVRLHLARTVVRRAERRIVALAATEPVQAEVLGFVNRLSDLLFAAAGAELASAGIDPELWDRDARPPSL